MKYKITIHAGLWINCECIPDSWVADTRNRYVGFVDSRQEAFGLVMDAIVQWNAVFEVHNYDKEAWRFQTSYRDDGFLATVEGVN